MTRKFELRKAVREQVPLLVALFGVSGGGKTYSALRLASGISRVTPGPICVIDTEARRALHYSRAFEFQHLEFKAPFSPNDYLAAIEHCVASGAKTIIIDSFSHEHEGPGGVLDMSEQYLNKKCGDNWKERDKHKFSSWIIPKQQRTRLLNTMLQIPVNFILCFRAKEKLKIVKNKEGKNEPTQIGLMPIGELGFVFEMTTSILLPPGASGVPQWRPQEQGSKMMVKLPKQFAGLLDDGKPLSEEHGEALARWAAGGPADAKAPEAGPSDLFLELQSAIESADFVEELDALTERVKSAKGQISPREFGQLRKSWGARRDELKSSDADGFEEEPTGT